MTAEPPALAEPLPVPPPQAAIDGVFVSFAASPWCPGEHGAAGMLRRGLAPLGPISPWATIGICSRSMPMSASRWSSSRDNSLTVRRLRIAPAIDRNAFDPIRARNRPVIPKARPIASD